jgi:protein-disulfide isomerase
MRVFFIYAGIALSAACFAETSADAPSKRLPVAMVAGLPITEDELTPLVEGQIRQLRAQEFQIRRKAVDDLINQRLVAARAKEKGVAPDELLRREVDGKLSEPTDGELEAFYLAQRNLANTPFAQVKNQLLVNLKQQRIEHARQEFIARLRQDADVSVMLRPPRVEVPFDPARVRGNPDAPITIVEFSDFQCPYCRNVTATLQAVMSKYKDKVRLAFRDFPLQAIHTQAEHAAEAGRCATEQGKFWEYHDLLFANQGKLADQDLIGHARTLGMDAKQFETCLLDGKFRGPVEEDIRAGTQAGVTGTPGFFINGVFLNGAQPLSTFDSMIEAELVSIRTQRH